MRRDLIVSRRKEKSRSSGKSKSGQAAFFLRVGQSAVRTGKLEGWSAPHRYLAYGIEAVNTSHLVKP